MYVYVFVCECVCFVSFANHLWNLIDKTAFRCFRCCSCFFFAIVVAICASRPSSSSLSCRRRRCCHGNLLFHLTVGHKFPMNCWRHGSNQFVFDHFSYCIPPSAINHHLNRAGRRHKCSLGISTTTKNSTVKLNSNYSNNKFMQIKQTWNGNSIKW